MNELDREQLRAALTAAGCVAADEEADELLAASGGDGERLASLLARRELGEPFAWIVGSTQLCGTTILVHTGVYVPRLQSEPLVYRAVELLGSGGTAVDLCTGSGAIARVIQEQAPSAQVFATDLDPRAVACAEANGVRALLGDLDDPLPSDLAGRVDVVIGVVPYVPTEELVFLPRDVRDYEPLAALNGGAAGTELLLRAAAAGSRLLVPGGTLLLELGGDEADVIAADLAALGYGEIDRFVDEEGDVRGIEAHLLR